MGTEKSKGAFYTDQLMWDVALEVLRNQNMFEFTATGASMSPFIRNKDIVVVSPWKPNKMKFGDIILYSTSQGAIQSPKRIHRIMKRRVVNGKSLLFTKGDASRSLDPPIEPNQVLGKISAIKKARWTLHLNQPWGKAINLTWALFQRWPLSMWMLRMGWKALKPLI